MFGLFLSDPEHDAALRSQAQALLTAQRIPFSGFTAQHAPLFHALPMTRNGFLRCAAQALLQPGCPLPLREVLTHLSGDALPGNVLRRYVCLQLSLLPSLRPGRAVTPLQGCFALGDALLVAPVDTSDCVDASLPPGQWTDLMDGTVYQTQTLRLMRGYNAMPILVRENTLLPVGVSDQSTGHDDADRVTLHWYQPRQSAVCVLADGTRYEAVMSDTQPCLHTASDKPWHFVIHQDGQEQLIV